MTANGNTVPEEGTLLWARPDGEGGAGGIEPLRAAVREFKLAVHCCGYAELPEPHGKVYDVDAVELWVEAARSRPGELTALLTAPLTNFALALRAYRVPADDSTQAPS